MIKAHDARGKYNEIFLERDTFIKEIIEPEILKAAQTQKFTKLLAFKEKWAGYSFDFKKYDKEKYNKDNHNNIELTRKILQTLRENGYEIILDIEPFGSGHISNGYIIISWDE